MQCLVDGLLDRKANRRLYPLPIHRKRLNHAQLLGPKHPRRDAGPVPVGVLEVHADPNAVPPRDQRHRKILLVGDAGDKSWRQRRSSVLVREHACAAQAQLSKQIAERQPAADELHLSETTERPRIIALVRMKPRQHGMRNRVRAGRQVHPREQPKRERDPERRGEGCVRA